MLNRNFAIALAVAMVLAVLYGCSSSGGIKNERDMFKEDAEMLQGSLDTANEKVMGLTGELDMAKARVTELDGMLATANRTNMDLQGELDMAKARVTELDDTIASLRTELGTATGNAGVLTARNAGFATAQTARENAIAAGTAATDAVSKATTKSGELDTLDVAGDSAMARQNAQDVLDAQADANQAVVDAKAALDSAKASAANLDVDIEADMSTDALTRALKEAIGVAETQYMAAMQSRDSDALKNAVEIITGAEPEAEDYPMEALDHGKAVAMDIGGALGPTSTADGGGMRVAHGAQATLEDAVRMENHIGKTWAEIVGTTMKMRIATDADDTDEVDAASITGQPSSSVTNNDTALAGTGLDDGAQHPGNYKGIPGTVFCAGGDCGVMEDADGNTLTGSWFFTPTEGDEWYVRNAADTAFMMETLYARFGHWLTATNTGATQVNTYAMTGGQTADINVTTVDTAEDATTLTDTSATYKGKAAGMSLHKEFDSQGMIKSGTLRSAAFTADVALTATFQIAPTLGGMVSNFMYSDGEPIDATWSVELLTRGFTGASFTTGGTTVASAQDGEWTAQAFGVERGRPTGIFGAFNAHFTNGHVAGAYATR